MAISKLSEAGQFVLEHATLITSDGTPIDLLAGNGVLAVDVYENIHDMSISGRILCADSINLFSLGPIIGQEFLRLRILTPQHDDDIDSVIDFMDYPLMITNHIAREFVANGVQAWVLEFSTRQFIINNRTKISRTLTGTWSDIATAVMRDDLQITKELFVNDTLGVKKFIAPNIRPHKIIEHAMHQGVSASDGDASYYCYETFTGMNFRTLGNMYSSPVVMAFQPNTPGTMGKGSFAALGTMYSYAVNTGMSLLLGYRDGRFASKLITHDLTSKSYQTHIYNYLDNFNNEPTIEATHSKAMNNPTDDHPSVSDISVDSEGFLRISDFPHRTFVQPTSTSGGKDNIYPDNLNQMPYTPHATETWLQERLARGKRLTHTMSVDMQVPGNTFLHAGDVVQINLPSHTSTNTEDKMDPYSTGKYLISSLHHSFNVGDDLHSLNLTCVKDSVLQPYSSGEFSEDSLYETEAYN